MDRLTGGPETSDTHGAESGHPAGTQCGRHPPQTTGRCYRHQLRPPHARALGKADVTAEHAGDADLDGFRIAAFVGRCLPVRRVIAAEIVRHPGEIVGIPLTEAQQTRARRFLTAFPQMPYAGRLAAT